MKILSTEQIRFADAYTIAHEPIASIDLMERASLCFVDYWLDAFDRKYPASFLVLCGMGNNGGDGLAIARVLANMGYEVVVVIIRTRPLGSTDFAINLERLRKYAVLIHEVNSIKDLPFPSHPDTFIIDALIGSGLDRPLEGLLLEVVTRINTWHQTKIAVDISSGLLAEQAMQGATAVEVDYTYSFQSPKLAFLFPENYHYVGEWHVLDIGLHRGFLDELDCRLQYLSHAYVRGLLKPRHPFAHKGDFGKVLLMAGSKGKIGAAILAGQGCLAAGAGLTTMHIPSCGYLPIQTALPELMISVSREEEIIDDLPESLQGYDAIGIGPGIGLKDQTVSALHQLLLTWDGPMVLDADAINILAQQRAWLPLLSGRAILTPHSGEFERLVGPWANEYARLELLQAFASQYQCVVILKGRHTAIATPDARVYFNSTGNPGMAKGGSGDVLTGIITALLGQGYNLADAACLGVYVHGWAGDLAAEKFGQRSMLPSHLCDLMGDAFRNLEN